MVKNIAAFAEDLHSVLNAYARRLTVACNSSYRRSSTLFWPPQGPTHM